MLVLMLCFDESLPIKYVSMNNQQCMVRCQHLLIRILMNFMTIYSSLLWTGAMGAVEDPFGRIWVLNKIRRSKSENI